MAIEPFVTLSFAQSLDGRIAARPGEQTVLSGAASMHLTHRLRATHDAILVGIGTVLADDPQLTVRHVEGPNPQPVVVDSTLRMPPDARLLDHPTHALWVATTHQAPAEKRHTMTANRAELLLVPQTTSGHVDLVALFTELGRRGIRSVMVEGGAGIITSILAGRLAHFAVITVAPVWLGSEGLAAAGQLHVSVSLRSAHSLQLGEDTIIWGWLV
ncbi:MAG: 5-amino-6-(5-phosphoribosylamino)uracil reductase [Chloroflexi bacterium]|nr:5-amino-6-(5-phosphoribosylamino)uracil reductase [Chloroflexota bacterium]